MHFHRRQVLLVGAIPFAPLAKAQHHRSQRACQRRGFIFDARGDFRVNVSDDQAVCLNSRSCSVSMRWVALGISRVNSMKRFLPVST